MPGARPQDLQDRLGRIVIAETFDRQPVTARDLKADSAMTVLLRDALQPNLAQTLENGPALVHGGPIANIAHGCNSVTATRAALRLSDHVVTGAGSGANLAAEKLLNIVCCQIMMIQAPPRCPEAEVIGINVERQIDRLF